MNHVIRNYRFNALEVDVIFIQKEKKYFEKAPISRSIFSLSNIKVKCMQPAEKKNGRKTNSLLTTRNGISVKNTFNMHH